AHLNHGDLLRLRLDEDFPQPPALELGERPGLLDADAVADLRRVPLVVSVESARALDRPGVLGMLHAALYLDHDRLVSLVGDHAADASRPAPASLDAIEFRLGYLEPSAFRSSMRW